MFLDLNGRKVDRWSTDNYKPLGCEDPEFEGNFGTMLRYKGFMLNAYFKYSYGGDIYNKTLVDKVENVDPLKNADRRVLYDRWKKPGDIAQYKDIKDASLTTLPTSRFVQDNAYLRLSALTLSYDFKREWIKKHLGLNMLRLEASSRDFINWNSIRQERGLSYPKSWTVDFSIKAQF